jgi:hypothetical protein
MRTIALTTFSNTTVNTYTRLELDGAGKPDFGAPQNIRLGARAVGSGAIAASANVTVRAVLCDKSNVYMVREFTVTTTAIPANFDGTGNDVVCTVIDNVTSIPVLDLLGAEVNGSDPTNVRDWRFGITTAAPANCTGITLYAFETNVI